MSDMLPFITNTQFLVRFDWRWVAKNVLDGPTAGTSASPPTLAQLQDPLSAAGSVLATFIDEASEMLMGAAAVAARYSQEDIRTYGGTLRDRIVSGLTMGLVLKRRARAVTDERELSASYTEAMDYIEQLRRGERIFWAVPDVPEAGLPGTQNQATYLPGTVPTTSALAARYFGIPAAFPGGVYGGNPYYPNPGPSSFPGNS